MQATIGDRLVMKGHRLGEHGRDGEILEVRGEDGGPPYLVRWEDNGRESLLFPGSDALVDHFPRHERRTPAAVGRATREEAT